MRTYLHRASEGLRSLDHRGLSPCSSPSLISPTCEGSRDDAHLHSLAELALRVPLSADARVLLSPLQLALLGGALDVPPQQHGHRTQPESLGPRSDLVDRRVDGVSAVPPHPPQHRPPEVLDAHALVRLAVRAARVRQRLQLETQIVVLALR